MNPAQKALWYIESHLAESFTLDEIADTPGSRAFTWFGRLPQPPVYR